MTAHLAVPAILDEVRRLLLEKGAASEVGLSVAGDDYRLEDDWLYVCVTPDKPGIRAYDHAEIMSQVERELRKRGIANVLLVPTLDE